MFRTLSLLALLASAAAVAAQEPKHASAGFGGVYADIAVDPLTGSNLHLGVAVDWTTGDFFVAASSGLGSGPHFVHRLDHGGVLRSTFQQPIEHNGSAFGMRDLEFDGQNLLGGSEAGISVFGTDGSPKLVILAANGPQVVVTPITGPGLTQLGIYRALALDPHGNGGNGSLLVADFASPILEIDFAGNVLRSWPNLGWSAYGLAIDPLTGNPWVFAGPQGRIEELDRQTMVPTGRSLAPVADGAPGGLAVASPVAFHHEYWGNRGAFVHLVQGASDHLGVQRLHLFPGVPGWHELQLRVGSNGGPLGTTTAPFWRGDTLDFSVVDPTGLRNGQPVWLVFNVYFDANRDAYTDLSPLVPGVGILWEHRSLNSLSVPATPNFMISDAVVGVRHSWAVPAGLGPIDRDLFRMQGLYFEPASPQQQIASTNPGTWQAQAREHGIVVAAAGINSFNGGQWPPFWTVTSDTSHGHGAITSVEISAVGASGSGALQRFDIDQNNMNDRFDGGNSTTVGHLGTYRNGSAATCGLDFVAPGVHVAAFHLPGESAGVAFSQPPDASGYVDDLRFRFTAFTPGKTFAFDCDTDGGVPSGDAHEGLIVRVTTANSGVLQGVLQVDPGRPDRAVVWFP